MRLVFSFLSTIGIRYHAWGVKPLGVAEGIKKIRSIFMTTSGELR